MQLYLLRHGDAESSPDLPDSERSLSRRGQQEVEVVGHYLKKTNTKIDLIISSPLTRARETTSIIQQHIQIEKSRTSEYLSPGVNPAQLFEELSPCTDPAVLLVGHEPDLSTVISLLISGNEQAHIEMKKASLACLAVQKPLQRGTGVLRWMLPVSLMETCG